MKPEPSPTTGAWFGEKPRLATTRWLSAESTTPSPFDVGRGRRHVEAVDPRVAVDVAGSAQLERVRAAPVPAMRSAKSPAAVMRKIAKRPARATIGCTPSSTGSAGVKPAWTSTASRNAPPCGSATSLGAHGERVEVRRPGGEDAVDRLREVVERRAEVRRDRARRDGVAVVDRDAAALAPVTSVSRCPAGPRTRTAPTSPPRGRAPDEVAELVVGVVERRGRRESTTRVSRPAWSLVNAIASFPGPTTPLSLTSSVTPRRGRDRGDAAGDVERPARARRSIGERVLRRVVRRCRRRAA